MRKRKKPTLQNFVQALERSLYERYCASTAIATPDSILLATLNAVADARAEVGMKADRRGGKR